MLHAHVTKLESESLNQTFTKYTTFYFWIKLFDWKNETESSFISSHFKSSTMLQEFCLNSWNHDLQCHHNIRAQFLNVLYSTKLLLHDPFFIFLQLIKLIYEYAFCFQLIVKCKIKAIKSAMKCSTIWYTQNCMLSSYIHSIFYPQKLMSDCKCN